jgi:hypothetical protein
MSMAGRSLLLCFFVVACGTPAPSPPVDGGADARATDAHAVDVGVDAGPPPGPRFCGVCHRDEDCEAGALCLALSGGEHACGIGCAEDADCASLPFEARCEVEADGLPTQCRPTTGSCVVTEPGSDCSIDACSGTYDRCIAFDDRSLCTTACVSDADCPIGMRRCLPRGGGSFCAPDLVTGPDACLALVASHALASCASSACASGSCYGAGDADSLALCLPDADAPCVDLPAPGGATVCAPPDCACALEDPTSLFGAALAAIGRTACDLRFDAASIDLFGTAVSHDRYRLSFTDRIRGYVPAVPRFGEEVATALDAAADGTHPVEEALVEAATLADLAPLPAHRSTGADLAIAIAGLVEAAGGVPDLPAIQESVGTLSGAARTTLAPIVEATTAAVQARERAVARLDADMRAEAFNVPSGLVLGAVGPSTTPSAPRVQGYLLGDVDMHELAQASIDLAATIESYALLTIAGENVDLTIPTPAGVIALRGPGNDTYEAGFEAVLLLIDLGGDDVYRAPVGATASSTNGVSVVIDLNGTDDYAYHEVPVASDVGPVGHRRLASDGRGRAPSSASNGPQSFSTSSRQGAGRLGIGMLFDLGMTNDHYRSLRMSQGYGALGVGVLYDDAGDDVYEGEAGVQGAGAFGLGLLLDAFGNDHYTVYAFGQGFGYVRGVGILHDGHGTDDFFSHPTDVLYWSPQAPGIAQSSFTQGAGFGRRDDSPTGVPMSGGLGVLRDQRGDDTYTTGIFGEGTGYWFGTGMLLEGAGADHYDGWWYVHGSAAHYAVALLADDDGADFYRVAEAGDGYRNTSVGVGHDFSVGWLVDRAGDDHYHAPNLSLGSGNAGGYGFFVDLGGDDEYVASSDFSFGQASIESPGDELRRASGTIGMFLDRGGTDTYTRPTPAPVASDSTWLQTLHTGEGESGVGVDAAAGRVGLGLD